MLKHIYELNPTDVFHFRNSLRPFIRVTMAYEHTFDYVYVDLSEGLCYDERDLREYEDLHFYNSDEVEIAGTIKEWF